MSKVLRLPQNLLKKLPKIHPETGVIESGSITCFKKNSSEQKEKEEEEEETKTQQQEQQPTTETDQKTQQSSVCLF